MTLARLILYIILTIIVGDMPAMVALPLLLTIVIAYMLPWRTIVTAHRSDR